MATIIRAKDQQRELLAELYNSMQKSNATDDPDAFIASVVNNMTDIELARLVTQDPEFKKIKHNVRLLSYKSNPVLIQGPSGTGKEILARALHGNRPKNRYHFINCASMPEKLIESELFGHVAGAFTGANKDHHGLFQSADNGTLFLDEIGEAPLALQAKLLRVLQPDAQGNYHIRPVGSNEYIKVNTRIVAATCVDLEQAIVNKTFREDLYGRLMTFELRTTSLTERLQDIPLILNHFGITDLSEQAEIYNDYWQQRVARYNVRALEAYAERKKAQVL